MPYKYRMPSSLKKGRKKINEAEEKILFRDYQNGNFNLGEILFKNYFYLVLKMVLKINSESNLSHLFFADLMNEGAIGLIRAIRSYSSDRGLRFSSYAPTIIRGTIYKAMKDKEASVRIPGNIYRDVREINKEIKNLFKKIGRAITLDEIAEELQLNPEDMKKLFLVFKKTFSLDHPLRDGDEERETFYDILSAENIPDQFSVLVQKERIEKISQAIECLNSQEKKVLILRFGLLGRGIDMTLEAIGQEMNLTRERIRQIEKQALVKVKQKLKKFKTLL